MLRRIYIKHIKCSNDSSRLWWNWQFCEKRSENWSRPIPSIGLGRQTTTTTTLWNKRSFIYADDLCITAQFPTFLQVESTIEEALGELTEYYRNNSLRANPDKTPVTAFHLRNREANRSLKVSWNGVDLENTTHPKYLGVILDRTWSYKQHIENTKMNIATRNNFLKKLQTQIGEQMQAL